MSEIEERKKANSRKWQIFYSPLVFIVLLVTLIFVARATWGVYNRTLTSSRERERVEGELAAIQSRQVALQRQVAVLETPQGVDEEIRAKFNVSKPGEGVALIVGSSGATGSPTVYSANKSWWQKLFGFLGF